MEDALSCCFRERVCDSMPIYFRIQRQEQELRLWSDYWIGSALLFWKWLALISFLRVCAVFNVNNSRNHLILIENTDRMV